MSKEFCDIDGEVVSADDLTISRAKDFAAAVEIAEFAYLVECKRKTSDSEIIVFDADIEVSQKPTHDIRHLERIAVIFDGSDATMPEILALRCDFPSVPHINLRSREFPRSLCITEQAYSEWKLHSTGATFVEEIRQWLISTAKGTLHADDQPLEPLLVGSEGELILPTDFFTNNPVSELLSISVVDARDGRGVFVAERVESVDENQNPFEYVATVFQSSSQPHGIIHSAPGNLLKLHKYLSQGNIDLLCELRNRLKMWKDHYEEERILEARLALVVYLPKTRHENATPEELELRAFLTVEPIKKIGIEIGLWDEIDGRVGYLIRGDQEKQGKKIHLGMLNPIASFSREMGARLNNLSSRINKKVAAVGLGALGSQVFMNLIRAGYGEWILIDYDILLPHNLARHALDGFSIGYPKVCSLVLKANQTLRDNPIADWITADVLKSSESLETREKLEKAFSRAEIILDASASVAVARYLVHDVDSSARRISIFFNPQGTDVIILAEDKERKITLDSLEMQYYRHLINEPSLENHLLRISERFRYATSCRDVSSVIPQDLVALQSAICSRAIHQITSKEEAFLSIWRTNTDQINTQRHSFSARNVIKCENGEWTLCSDEGFIDKIHEVRAKKLPNETGGVLIGSYDMQRKIVYIADFLPSPPDSEEWPTVYIRGCQGLRSQIEEIQQITANQLKYVGEWHSHPPGCSVKPSPDDRHVFDWLSDHMKVDGLPPLMLIVGDLGKYAFYLGQID